VIKTHENEENNKINENDIEIEDGELVTQKKRKRIYNPYTGKYYELRRRTTTKGTKGQIKGLWKPPKRPKKKSIWDLFR
jgi:hypothetical protein